MKMKDKVLISTTSFQTESLQILERENYEFILNPFGRKLAQDEVIQLGEDCIGIIAGTEPLDARVLEALPCLRCISRCGVGVDNIDLEAAGKLGITVTITTDGSRAVAELTIGLIIDMLRKISFLDRNIRNGNWHKDTGSLLLSKRVGIVGLGRIGRIVAELLLSLGARVAGIDIKPDQKWLQKSKVRLLSLGQLLKESEILCLHVSLTQNRPLIGSKEIQAMRRGAYLVNLSRGEVIDEDALYIALTSGHLAGAALDVFSQEPYTGPLTTLNNIVLTPHIGSYTRESRLEMEKQAVNNLLAVVRQ